MSSRKPDLVISYCEAVDESWNHHPIQPASIVPEGVFGRGGDFYECSVCAYDADGRPLHWNESAKNAQWILFDNVYARHGGRYPEHADRMKARRAGFAAAGRKAATYDIPRALALWSAAVNIWGPPEQDLGWDPGNQHASSLT